jgi:hypothetical protein
VGGKLFDDHFYNGDPFAVALWRIPREKWGDVRLKVLPWFPALDARLPGIARKAVADANAAGTLDRIQVSVEEQLELQIQAR